MRKAVKAFIKIIKNHQLAICFAVFVGLIYLTPYIVFSVSLGDKYQGIPMLATANEDYYLARMQEIKDGHPFLGSFIFYEYKDQLPLTWPTAEMFYAIPSLLFGIFLIKILIASKFVLPFILFLLVYFLIHKLSASAHKLSNKLNAIAGAMLVTLGYDLVNYRHVWLYLTGKVTLGGNFLTWARPVNPVMGAIFLFSFLICVWLIIQKSRYKKSLIFLAALFLSLMICSYFFSWGVAVSVLGILILMYLLKRNYTVVKNFLWVIFLTIIMTLPYWYMSFKASQSPWYKESVLRSGLFYTHYPLLNKLLIATILFYLIIVILSFVFRKDKIKFNLTYIKNWHLFSLSLLLGGFWAFNQQIITGMTIWPYHFVHYTIPLSMVVIIILLYNIIKKWKPFLWALAISIIASSSLIFGILVQIESYQINFDYYAKLQPYKSVFNWLNSQEKDSVVLVKRERYKGEYNFNLLIPAFTHANIYASNIVFSLMPQERVLHNYAVYLRIKGINADNIERYIEGNMGEAVVYLFSNWKGLYGIKQFSDFSDPVLGVRIENFPAHYREFMSKNFRDELDKYRIDYILSDSPLPQSIIKQLSGTELVFKSNNIFIYDFK